MRLLLLLALFAKSLRTTGCLAMPSRMLREHWRWVIPAAWVLMSYLIGDYTSSHAVEKRRELLASMCDERACMLQCQVNANMNCLQELAICASTLDHSKNLSSAINQMTFARYSERTVWVNQTERQQFERRQTWCINKQSPSPSPSPRPRPRPRNAEVRKPADEYSPVIFAHDTYNYKHIISFDLLSGSDDRDSVLRARESGKGVLTAPFKLLNNRIGVLLTFALYKYELPPNARPQERIQAAIGYLGGILDIEWLIDNLLRQLGGKQSITVNVYDTTYERPLSMHGSNDIGSGMCHVSPLCHVSTLNFGDPSRKHEMHCRFIQSPPWPWMAVENSDMISVGLRKMTGNNDSSGQQQHWYLHISSKYQEKATEMQNGTAKPHQPAHMSHKNTVGLWIALVSVTVLVLGIAVVWVLLWCNRSKRVQQNELELSGGIIGPRRFHLYELVAATSNFAYENKLGQGGFGPVYKGYLQNQDCHVAIKVLSSQQQSVQGLREFTAEVKVMTQLRHRNIVNLVGWCECDSQQRLLLVYELMAQGSLDKHLYDPEEILTWQQRYKIVLDLGNALLYLHRDCEKCIVHGDIMSVPNFRVHCALCITPWISR